MGFYSNKNKNERLRFSIQTLHGNICDDRNQDSEESDFDGNFDYIDGGFSDFGHLEDLGKFREFGNHDCNDRGLGKASDRGHRPIANDCWFFGGSRRVAGARTGGGGDGSAIGSGGVDGRGGIGGARRREWGENRYRYRREKQQPEYDDEDDEMWQRKRELGSVLRRLRAAIRRMDGALAEAEVCPRNNASEGYGNTCAVVR